MNLYLCFVSNVMRSVRFQSIGLCIHWCLSLCAWVECFIYIYILYGIGHGNEIKTDRWSIATSMFCFFSLHFVHFFSHTTHRLFIFESVHGLRFVFLHMYVLCGSAMCIVYCFALGMHRNWNECYSHHNNNNNRIRINRFLCTTIERSNEYRSNVQKWTSTRTLQA